MRLTDRQLLHFLSRMPFVESTELALILGEPHATVHRHLTGLLDDGVVERAIHGTTRLPSSGRYCLTAKGIRQAAEALGFDTPSDFVRAYPMSREWLTLLLRRMVGLSSSRESKAWRPLRASRQETATKCSHLPARLCCGPMKSQGA